MRVLAALSEKVSPMDVPCRDASPSSAAYFLLCQSGTCKRKQKGDRGSESQLLYKILSSPFPPKTSLPIQMLSGQSRDAIHTSPLILSCVTNLQLRRPARNEGSCSPTREGVPKGPALQRCQSFIGHLDLPCQSGTFKRKQKGDREVLFLIRELILFLPSQDVTPSSTFPERTSKRTQKFVFYMLKIS